MNISIQTFLDTWAQSGVQYNPPFDIRIIPQNRASDDWPGGGGGSNGILLQASVSSSTEKYTDRVTRVETFEKIHRST